MVRLTFRTFTGTKHTLELQLVNDDEDSVMTVAQLKERLAPLVDIPVDAMRLIAAGRILKEDDSPLTDFNLESDMLINVVRVAAGTLSPSSSTVASSPAATSASSPSVPSPRDPSLARANPANPLSALGMSPDMMRGMIDMITANPALMQFMINSDPRLQQIMEQNPQVRQLLSDPQFLREHMQMLSNPNMMQEMLRNQDRQLSNIEALPGGMNFLSSMFRDIQEPLSAPREADPSSDEVNQRFAQALGATPRGQSTTLNDQALPNPWARPASTPQSPSALPTFPNPPASFSNPAASLPNPLAPQSQPPMNIALQMQMLQQQLQMLGLNNPAQPASTTPATTSPAPAFPPFPFMMPFAFPQQPAAVPETPAITSPAASTPTSTAAAPTEPPAEERFATQLELMREMGFTDTPKCIRALLASGGNTDAAVAYLFDSP